MTEPSQPDAATPPTRDAPAPAPSAPPGEDKAADAVIPLAPLPPLPAPVPLDTRWTGFEVFLFVLLTVFVFLLGSAPATNSEVWMHLATGRALAQGQPFSVDPFSYTTADTPWINHSWLYSLGLYALFNLGGGMLLVVLKALLGVALFFVLFALRPRDYSRVTTMELAALAMLVLSPRLQLSPMTLTYLLYGVTLYLLYRGGMLGGQAKEEASCSQAIWWLPPLFVLWVNVDTWFFLGPLTMLLCLIGLAVTRGLGDATVKRLGLATLFGCGAFVVNPFHVHAFTVPAEFAYVLGGPGRNLSAGGEALHGLLRVEPAFAEALELGSPLASAYWSNWARGLHVAGLSYFVLLGVSVLSFLPVLIQWGRSDGVPFSLARLLVWVVPVVLGILQVRMIPLLAVAAAPVAVLNLADFARWRRLQPWAATAHVFHPGVARLAITVLVFVALALVWPGWLHGRIGAPSVQRHVAWRLQEDESLRKSAEALAQLHAEGKAERVFNLSLGFANYCAWFAPGVQCHFDMRFALFAKEAGRYAKAKAELFGDAVTVVHKLTNPGPGAWQELFEQRKVDHLAVPNFGTTPSQTLAAMCWLHPRHWEQRYGDGRTLVFAWSAQEKFAPFALLEQWNREAFGPVPAEARAPADGALPPLGENPWWEQYTHGPPPASSLEAAKPAVWEVYAGTVTRRWPLAYGQAWAIASWLKPVGLSGAAPGNFLGLYTLWENVQLPMTRPFQVLAARDSGPPATPYLMIRAARRALAQDRFDPSAHLALFSGTRAALALEEFWIDPERRGPKTLRTQLRHMQLVTALRNYLDLRPDDWFFWREFALLQAELYQLDAAHDSMLRSLKELEKAKRQATGKGRLDELKAYEKDMQDRLKSPDGLERTLKRRRSDYERNAGQLKNDPFLKFQFAVLRPYQTLDSDNRPVVDQRGMGLIQEGLTQLMNMSLEGLSAAEKGQVTYWKCQTLLRQGRVAEASRELADPSALGAHLSECLLWIGAATGSYDQIEEAATRLEQLHDVQAVRQQLRRVALDFLSFSALEHWPYHARIAGIKYLQHATLLPVSEGFFEVAHQAASIRTLQGIFAIERGDTAAAERHFAAALSIVGPDLYFLERPIAVRCLELLRQQQ